jgi:uncharacterized membrane protein
LYLTIWIPFYKRQEFPISTSLMFCHYISCIYSYRLWKVLTVLLTVILSHIHISLMFCYYISCIYSNRLWNILTVLLTVILSHILISFMFCYYISYTQTFTHTHTHTHAHIYIYIYIYIYEKFTFEQHIQYMIFLHCYHGFSLGGLRKSTEMNCKWKSLNCADCCFVQQKYFYVIYPAVV